MPRLYPEKLNHERNNIRLRDGLSGADRERTVFVGIRLQSRLDEQVAGDLSHRRKDPLIDDIPGPELLLDHPPSRRFRTDFILVVHASSWCDQMREPREGTAAQERGDDGESHDVSPCDCCAAGRESCRIKNNSPDLSQRIRAHQFDRHPFQSGGLRPLVMPSSAATPRVLIQVILQMPGFGPHAQFLLRALLDLSDSLPREFESFTDLFQSHRLFFPQPEA